jgi:integrase
VGVVRRPDSPFWWLILERPGQKPIRMSTKIPIVGPTEAHTKENRHLANIAYSVQMRDLARLRFQLPVEKAHISFKAYRAWYAEQISIHKRAHAVERSILKTLGRTFDSLDLADITLHHGREWRTARARIMRPATVNRELALLKHVLSSAVPKYLDANPLDALTGLRVPDAEPRILSPDEEMRLLAVLDVEQTALILCALDTLQRLSSVASLKRAQDHGTYLHFLNTKTRANKVPVSARLRTALDALPDAGPYLFPTYHSKGRSVEAVRKAVIQMFYEVCAKADIETGHDRGLTFHGLRHTGASRMLERGIDIETVRRIGGWSNLTILRRYLHPSDEASHRAVNIIGPRT